MRPHKTAPTDRHNGCECGGTYRPCRELGIDPYTVFMDYREAWYARDAFICDKCGSHLLPPRREKLNH